MCWVVGGGWCCGWLAFGGASAECRRWLLGPPEMSRDTEWATMNESLGEEAEPSSWHHKRNPFAQSK